LNLSLTNPAIAVVKVGLHLVPTAVSSISLPKTANTDAAASVLADPSDDVYNTETFWSTKLLTDA